MYIWSCINRVEQRGCGPIPEWRQYTKGQPNRHDESLVHRTVHLVRVTRTSKAGHEYSHPRKDRRDKDDHQDKNLHANADGRIANMTHVVTDQHLINDTLQSADDVLHHGRPGEKPDRVAKRPFDDASIKLLLGLLSVGHSVIHQGIALVPQPVKTPVPRSH